MTVTGHPSDTDEVMCGPCWKLHPVADTSNLTDRNGHAWFICPDCINKLWHSEQPMAQPETVTVDGTSKYVIALPILVGSMSIIVETLRNTNAPDWTIRAMEKELDTARKVYET